MQVIGSCYRASCAHGHRLSCDTFLWELCDALCTYLDFPERHCNVLPQYNKSQHHAVQVSSQALTTGRVHVCSQQYSTGHTGLWLSSAARVQVQLTK